jgi:hypothetical protein
VRRLADPTTSHVRRGRWDAPSGLDEIDLLDELTPPFMRHEEASDDPPSALDVEALRALVDVRDGR